MFGCFMQVSLLEGMYHANIVELIDVFAGVCAGDIPRLILARGGHTLEAVYTLPEFDTGRAPYIVQQLLQAVLYLQENDIIHCNIEPTSVLLDVCDIVQLSAFEDARIERAGFREEISDHLAAKHGLAIGRLEFRALELLLGDTSFSFSVDSWSIGCLFWSLLIQRPCFPGQTVDEMVRVIFKATSGPTAREAEELACLPRWEEGFRKAATQEDWASRRFKPEQAEFLTGMLCLAPSRFVVNMQEKWRILKSLLLWFLNTSFAFLIR